MYRWRRAIGEGGVEALASKGSSGASCRLDDDQLRRLGDALDRGPVAHGFGPDQRWTLARITELFDRLFGVRYTLRGTSYLLHRMGFSPQVLARRAAEQGPAQIADWHTRRWPSVRDERWRSGPGSASRTRRVRCCDRRRPGPGPGAGTSRW
ncbi:winged helix-turn-helix domain-containing protein [Dactylosporangium cerinum]|uniref:Winged helix-turn-helix domain-containing protein n=1 Tax=Dactylosporangium cerinum TaxID=1434730 RepID=A0ABV9WEJ0_9ACTN